MEGVAIWAPAGRDARVIGDILASAGVTPLVQADCRHLVDALSQGEVGALVVSEEAFSAEALRDLEAWLAAQPPWSDLPIILLVRRQRFGPAQSRLTGRLGNVTVLERPFHPATLVSSVAAALRARARQHATQLHMEELAKERQALGDSEARYRTLFTAMDEGFCIIEFLDGPHGPASDYIHVEANPAYERHAGIFNVVGRKLREIVPDEAEGWLALYKSVLETGQPIRFERELVATRRHLELAAFRVEPASRRQVAVIFQDVTRRKQAEIRLRELNDTLERRVSDAVAERKILADIVDGTDAFVQVADTEFRWLAINKAAAREFERIFGVRPRLGQSMLDTLKHKPKDREEVAAIWSRALAGEEFTEVAEFGDPDHDRRFYEAKFNVLRDQAGRIVGAYQFVYDVTERLLDQQKLAEATARMHELAKMETLGQLTGGVAHDFNNLLTPIVGALDLLSRRAEGDARARRLIGGALESAERAGLLVQRLLAFARRQHLEARPIDVAELICGMRDMVQRSIGSHIPVALDISAGLPAARVDPNQLELAVLNLAVNARDAMAGGGQLTIAVTEAVLEAPAHGLEPGHYVRLSVTDTGAGMDETTLRRAVEPFFTTKGQGKGTGLGLSMVHGLAAQSGGGLVIRSQVGKGTTAELWLPATEAVPATLGTLVGQMPVQPRQATILLVDDEDLVRSATAAMLQDMGHDVVEAASASAALMHLGATSVDLLITDHLMPQMRGAALVAEARKIRPDLPVLIVSGYHDLNEREAAETPRLAKPFREHDLAREVARLLEVSNA